MKHTPESKQALLTRLRRIEGQVRGIAGMVEDEIYCIDIITQTSAVKQAISSIEDILMEEHLGHCVKKQMTNGDHEKSIKEILQVYKLKRK